ncbi:MAG: GNAT family N-acetyltransferase [Planctomycetota bacterium]
MSGDELAPWDKCRVYEQTLAGEYLRYMRAWIGAHPGAGFEAELVAGDESAPAGVFAGPVDAVVTDCIGLGFHGPVGDEVIDRVEGVFGRCESIPEIECGPYAHPTLLAQLERRGYGVRNYLQVFWMDLTEAPAERVSGVEVRRVDEADAADLELAVRTIARGREGVAAEPTEPARVMAEQVAACAQNATFLAFIDGKPAGGSTVGLWHDDPLCSAGHANLFGGSTLPWARRRGVQRALMLERLRYAHEAGARSVSLDCEPMIASERNARRVGFELVCTKGVFVREPFVVPTTSV